MRPAWPGYLALVLGAVPLLWLVAFRRKADAPWWWMASGFGVSVVADAFGAFGLHPLAHQVYPVSQAALVTLPMLPRRWWVAFVGLMLAVASVSVVTRLGLGLDVALRVVAFGGVAGFGWWMARDRALQVELVVYFGLGLVAWLAYVAAPGWWTYGGMQGVRLAGVALWCRAAWRA